MGVVTMGDARVKQVTWRDLVELRWWERVWELTLSGPWLVVSLAAYGAGWWPIGVVGSFFFFLTGLRQSHNAQHYCLGIGRRGHDVMLAALSVIMATSMHAVQVTHLHHHRHCLDDEDIEAAQARWPGWLVLLSGPMHPVRLHTAAWRIGSTIKRRWIAGEVVAIVVWVVLVFFVLNSTALRWHTAAMIVGECFTGFFAVWTVHHGCEIDGQIARTQRGWLKNVVSYSMFFHLEHHLFPAVPTCHLAKLADRLDEAAPGYDRRQVF